MKFETPEQAREYIDKMCGTQQFDGLGDAQIKIATKIYELETRVNALYDELGTRQKKIDAMIESFKILPVTR